MYIYIYIYICVCICNKVHAYCCSVLYLSWRFFQPNDMDSYACANICIYISAIKVHAHCCRYMHVLAVRFVSLCTGLLLREMQYIYIYIYIYIIHTHIYIYTHTHKYISVQKYMHMLAVHATVHVIYVCINKCTYVCIHTYMAYMKLYQYPYAHT